MKILRTDAHDRLIHFKNQSDYISEGCQSCIKNRPPQFGNLPFYIFAHKREIETDERISLFNQDLQESLLNPLQNRKYWKLEDVPTHRLIWSPRLTKPKAQTNSMLFKVYPPGDNIKVIWILPARELWDQYVKGNLTENKTVIESIHTFTHDRSSLEAKEEDDLSDEHINRIYEEIANAKA